MTITDVLLVARPSLSVGSIKTYTSIITSLGKQMEKNLTTPEAVIEAYEAIIKHLTDTKPSVRKTKLACLVVFISKTPAHETATEALRTLMLSDKVEADEETKTQTLSERQQEGWLPWTEVLERYDTLEKDVARLWKKPSLDKGEFHLLQTYVLLSCLVLLPVRRSMDWVDFRLRNADEAKSNYMTYEKRKPIMVFNSYKTKATYGQQRLPIVPKLATILKRWTEKSPHDSLLVNYHQSGAIGQTQLTQLLHGFFGKPISTSLLRHIYLSHLHKDTPAITVMEETATNMAHSVSQAMDYVKKPVEMLATGGVVRTKRPMTANMVERNAKPL